MKLAKALALVGSLLAAYAWLMYELFWGDPEPAPAAPAKAAGGSRSLVTVSAATCLEDDDEDPVQPAPPQATKRIEHEAAILWPAPTSALSSSFGPRTNPIDGRRPQFHRGVDIPVPCGTAVLAAEDGAVIFAQATKGSGNTVKLAHAGGWVTRYAHLSRIDVSAGAAIRAGQKLGVSGSTGRSTGPHLHFEIIRAGYAYDPLAFRYYKLPEGRFGPREPRVACWSEPSLGPVPAPGEPRRSSFPSTLGYEAYRKQ